MGFATIQFQGAVCHAIDTSPKIQRALVVNGENFPGHPHYLQLIIPAKNIDRSRLSNLPSTYRYTWDTGANLGILNKDRLDETMYFVIRLTKESDFDGGEVGVEDRMTDQVTSNNVRADQWIHLRQIEPTFILDGSCYTDHPDEKKAKAYVELSGELTSCPAKHKAQFPKDNAPREIMGSVSMKVETKDDPKFFIRRYGSNTKDYLPTQGKHVTITIINEASAAMSEPTGNQCDKRHDFELYYTLGSGSMKGPVPCESGELAPHACPHIFSGTTVGSSNAGVP
jgi:hypothetical protein